MKKYPFLHNGHVYIVEDDKYQVAYYVRDRLKYKRIRSIASQEWENTIEQSICNDIFWMVVACIERKGRHA